MIPLNTPVTVAPDAEPGIVTARIHAFGRVTYHIRFQDGRVREFGENWLTVVEPEPVVRLPFRPRLVVDNPVGAPR